MLKMPKPSHLENLIDLMIHCNLDESYIFDDSLEAMWSAYNDGFYSDDDVENPYEVKDVNEKRYSKHEAWAHGKSDGDMKL